MNRLPADAPSRPAVPGFNISVGTSHITVTDAGDDAAAEIQAWLAQDDINTNDTAIFITSPHDARDAAAALLRAAAELEARLISESGKRLFEGTQHFNPDAYTDRNRKKGLWVVGHVFAGEFAGDYFTVPVRSDSHADTKAGYTWGAMQSRQLGRVDIGDTHECIAIARYVSSYENAAGETIHRYVEVEA